MGGEVCRQKGRERGPWFEIECVKEVITSKEAKGQDAAFERALLRAWAKYPGWQAAEMPSRTRRKPKSSGIKP